MLLKKHGLFFEADCIGEEASDMPTLSFGAYYLSFFHLSTSSCEVRNLVFLPQQQDISIFSKVDDNRIVIGTFRLMQGMGLVRPSLGRSQPQEVNRQPDRVRRD